MQSPSSVSTAKSTLSTSYIHSLVPRNERPTAKCTPLFNRSDINGVLFRAQSKDETVRAAEDYLSDQMPSCMCDI
jgi:hypothetical protein